MIDLREVLQESHQNELTEKSYCSDRVSAMHSESRPGGSSYRNASLPCRRLAHDSGLKRGSAKQKVIRALKLKSRTFYVILRFNWKALIVTRCFEVGIAIAGIDEHLL